ncbi:acyl-CoA thioester hydrolase [Amycolatopsis arida]|uniref:Acyl-CoA thioester hydrolase n=1 Tax=Amycolatopsis arida TaxID=587909 RepID=A0A1I5S699_9PSEU|nr:acyl-CoA thioesterase [Amycolatopsis arida]TDX85297.1 acyl-CoA thioester hydrolase [Amycolatopsis arida]SFP66245.1 acyl-CoA thioester hydrolase [Amycolatopsis arida]
MGEAFSMRFTVRAYELDPQRHLTGPVYVQYADHTRYECVRAAGVSVDELLDDGMGPVNLETVLRFRHELRGGDEVDVTCAFHWGSGRTYRVEQSFTRADGVLAAEVSSVSGLLDLRTRHLVPDPATHWRARATHPEQLNLDR